MFAAIIRRATGTGNPSRQANAKLLGRLGTGGLRGGCDRRLVFRQPRHHPADRLRDVCHVSRHDVVRARLPESHVRRVVARPGQRGNDGGRRAHAL